MIHGSVNYRLARVACARVACARWRARVPAGRGARDMGMHRLTSEPCVLRMFGHDRKLNTCAQSVPKKLRDRLRADKISEKSTPPNVRNTIRCHILTTIGFGIDGARIFDPRHTCNQMMIRHKLIHGSLSGFMQGARTQRSESPHSDRNRRCPPRSKSAPGGTSRGSLFLFFFSHPPQPFLFVFFVFFSSPLVPFGRGTAGLGFDVRTRNGRDQFRVLNSFLCP